MKYTYKVKNMGSADGPEVIYRVEDGAWIPKDEGNPDYQAYLNKDKPQTPAAIDETPAE